MKPQEQTGKVPLSLTVQEAAFELRCSPRTIYNKVADGTLESFTFGRSRRIVTSSLRNLIGTEAA